MKKNILIVADKPLWAYHNLLSFIKKKNHQLIISIQITYYIIVIIK